MVSCLMGDSTALASAIVRCCLIIPYCSENPEKAMELWEMMYTNAEISNLFVNDVEGIN